jgi:uncharacterized membrane protein YccC
MLQGLIELKPRDVPLRVALRNAAAIVLPLASGVAFGHVGIGLGICVGALTTQFTDQPGAYRLRMRRMLATALIASLSAFVGAMLGSSTVLVVIAALAWGIGGGLLVALGPDAGRAGLTAMILLVILSAEPRAPEQALAAAALIFLGGALQTAFAIAAWPLQRYRPEREALALVCRQLAAGTRHGIGQGEAPPVTEALLAVEGLLHGKHRAHGEPMEIFRILAELLERIRLELLALDGVRTALGEGSTAAAFHRALEYAARTLDAAALALDSGSSPLAAAGAMEGLDSVLGALRSRRDSDTDADSQRQLTIGIARLEGLAGQLRAALRNTDIAGSRGDLRRSAAESRLPRPLRPRGALTTLRANLRPDSVALRHAVRCGVCLALALAASRARLIDHAYWMPMTVAIVLKPDFAGTLRVGVLRVAGTLVGLVLATVLVHYAFGGVWERLALLALLCVAFRLLVAVHYGLAVTMLTALVVILLTFEGIAPADTMLARGVATVIGSAFALVAYRLWPTWERRSVRVALATMLDAYRRYFGALLHDDAGARAAARSAARSARTNAQASLARLRGEPRIEPRLVPLAEAVLANANRFVRAGMALEAVLQDAPGLPARAAFTDFAGHVDAALVALVASLRDATPAPSFDDLRSRERALAGQLDDASDTTQAPHATAIIEACDRMVDSLDTRAWVLAEARAGHRAAAATGTA